MVYRIGSYKYPTRILLGFTAGFFGTLILNQTTVWVLYHVGVSPFNGFSMVRNGFGVPMVLSAAFWGGVWGIVFALVEHKLPVHRGYLMTAFLFGAVVLSVVFLLVVLPLKGEPVGGGWHLPLLLTVFLGNGAWGIGTGLVLEGLLRWMSGWRHVPA